MMLVITTVDCVNFATCPRVKAFVWRHVAPGYRMGDAVPLVRLGAGEDRGPGLGVEVVVEPLVSLPELVIAFATLTSAAPCIESILSPIFVAPVVFTDEFPRIYRVEPTQLFIFI